MVASTLILPAGVQRDIDAKRIAAREMTRDAVKKIASRYDAAQTTDDNTRHWRWADGLSANAANNPAVRKTLRDRARYEMGNNTYCKGIVQTVANNTIGKGPRLQLRTGGGKQADKRLNTLWRKWAKEVQLAAKLRTMVKGRVSDGESFATITTNMRLRSQVKLDFKPFEPEICTSLGRVLPVGKAYIDGIDFDDFDNEAIYWLLPFHPGDTNWTGLSLQPVAHDAANIIHLFKCERAGQKRGVPEITAALPLFAQLRRYTLAVLAAAEIAALLSVYLETSGQITPSEVTAWTSFDMERNAGMVMPEGWKASQFKAEQPCTTYSEFKQEILNEISRCLDMPYNIAACNSSGYNYSSGKLDHKTYGVSTEIDRTDLENACLDRLLAQWLREAALIPGLIPAGLDPVDEWEVQWFWDEAPSADPLKDANAQDVKLRNGSALISDEWESQGRDFEDEVERDAEKLGVDPQELKTLILNSIYKATGPQQQPDQPGDAAPQGKHKPTSKKKGTADATTGA